MTMVSDRDHYSHQQEHKITVMLIAVVILALLCQMPTAVLLLYSTVYEPPSKTPTFAIMRGLGNIFNLLNAVNAAANFILYCAFSDKYRRTFLLTFVPCAYHQQPLAHSFVASVTAGSVGRGSNTNSIKSVCRRVSKSSSTPSPMPPRDTSPHLTSGCFKENGIGALDARVTLQYGFGRSPHHLTLSPPLDTHQQLNNTHSLVNKHSHVSPMVRTKQATQAFSSSIYPGQSPVENTDREDAYHRQISKENLHNVLKAEVNAEKNFLDDMETTVLEITPTPSSSLSSVEENNPLEFKFIDDESCETSRSSPASTTRKMATGDADIQLPDQTSENCGASPILPFSKLIPPKSSKMTNSSTILSPD
nr:uncharacterized protein LOC123749465 [Procambarus clarkii]